MTPQNSAIAAVLALVLSACAGAPPTVPEPLLAARGALPPAGFKNISDPQAGSVEPATSTSERSTSTQPTPTPPASTRNSTLKAEPPSLPASTPAEPGSITVAFDQLPLPNFIQAVYALILKKTYSLDPKVASRTDLVTLRAAQPQTPAQLENAARLLLKTYGIAVTDLGAGNYRMTPDNAQTGYTPEIWRGRALPDVPLRLRPIYQLVDLRAVRSTDLAGWLSKIFGPKVNIVDDSPRNTLILSGQTDDVKAVLAAIELLDQPLMKGRQSLRINPVFWSADELSKKLTELLSAEGYAVAVGAGGTTPVNLVPIQGINAIIVFAADQAVLDHIVKWVQEVDRPSTASTTGGGGYFTYQARYTNAQNLATTMQAVLGDAQAAAPAPNYPAGAVVVGTAPKPAVPSKVIVDVGTNTLIFQGGSDSYAKLLNLLQEIDKPARSALIEVTVAEVTLDDTTQLGVEWALANSGASGNDLSTTGGTLGGLSIGKGGLTIKRINSLGDVRLIINMLATSSKANVLSTPRIMTRNGESSTIQVGSEIPTITSVQTTPTTGTNGVLQSVQYRKTGIILTVKPTIYAGDRIDLDISQEVSDSSKVGVAGSPIIDTRKVDTRLSLKDGSPVLLGGLIQQHNSRGESGIPLLKDIPGVGQLFRTNTDNASKTELLVLITPYIIADDHDAQEITQAFRSRLGPWALAPAAASPASPASSKVQ
jgi:general secretion pathway protein D